LQDWGTESDSAYGNSGDLKEKKVAQEGGTARDAGMWVAEPSLSLRIVCNRRKRRNREGGKSSRWGKTAMWGRRETITALEPPKNYKFVDGGGIKLARVVGADLCKPRSGAES